MKHGIWAEQGLQEQGLEGWKLGSITEWQAREVGALSLPTWVTAMGVRKTQILLEEMEEMTCIMDGGLVGE